MYYLMVETAFKTDLKLNTFCCSKSYVRLGKRHTNIADYKFYQKLFVVLISLSIFLIFPESPRELENICESYNFRKLCNVW